MSIDITQSVKSCGRNGLIVSILELIQVIFSLIPLAHVSIAKTSIQLSNVGAILVDNLQETASTKAVAQTTGKADGVVGLNSHCKQTLRHCHTGTGLQLLLGSIVLEENNSQHSNNHYYYTGDKRVFVLEDKGLFLVECALHLRRILRLFCICHYYFFVIFYFATKLRRKITENIADIEIYLGLFSFLSLKSSNFAEKYAEKMILERLSIINYKNIREATLTFSPKINCFIGHNGAGKTNVLDAVYFMSFCHSAHTTQDSLVIKHGEEFFVLEGKYADAPQHPTPNTSLELGSLATKGTQEHLDIYCGMKRGTKKHFKRNKKEYKRLSEHIGLIPIVLVSPADNYLVEGGSEERRRLMDVVIAQLDHPYIEALNRYNKALQQRNTMLKQEDREPDPDVLALWEEEMARSGEIIYEKRRHFVDELTPLFQQFYETISGGHEQVALCYTSHCQRGPLLEVIQRDRMKDRAVGYSLHGIHRDDLEMTLDGHPMRREGSQGQLKTFAIALKLAQFEFLKQTGSKTTPLLLLDDIFDKLDATRVEKIIQLVAGDQFGQIFITDTNRDHLDQILSKGPFDYRLFHVSNGEIA